MSEEHEQMLLDAVKKLANAVLNQGQQLDALRQRVTHLEQQLYRTEAVSHMNMPYEG